MTNNTGRKPGAKNKSTAKQKDEMREILLPRLKEINRSMATIDPARKVKLLLDFLPYLLPKGSVSEEENEIQELIYKQLEPHYKRLDMYFNHVPQERKATLLKGFYSLSATKQKATILPIIKKQLGSKKV